MAEEFKKQCTYVLTVQREKEVTRIDKNGEKITKNIC